VKRLLAGRAGKRAMIHPVTLKPWETGQLAERGPFVYVLGEHCSQHVDTVLREILVDGKLSVDDPISTLQDPSFRSALAPNPIIKPISDRTNVLIPFWLFPRAVAV